MGRVSTCQKNCNTIDLRGAQVNDCWWLGGATSHGISSHWFDLDPVEYPTLHHNIEVLVIRASVEQYSIKFRIILIACFSCYFRREEI